MVGTSFGGNYLMRYFLRRTPSKNIGGLVVLAPPLDVGRVVE
jgi:predicted alpha/beta-fold hydrolase